MESERELGRSEIGFNLGDCGRPKPPARPKVENETGITERQAPELGGGNPIGDQMILNPR